MRVLFFIPARAGSKGIPHKNRREINNMSLVEHAIRFAKHVANVGDQIVVSSDDPVALALAQDLRVLGHERSQELSGDSAKIADVVYDYILQEISSENYDWIVLLEPTSPFRSVDTFAQIQQAFTEADCNSIITAEKSTRVSWKFSSAGDFVERAGAYQHSNRQKRHPTLIEANSFFAVNFTSFMQKKDFFVAPTKMVIVNQPEALDINVEADLMLAQIYGETYGIF